MHPQQAGNPAGNKGRQEAGQQRRREHGAHRLKLHTEQSRCQRCAEQTGKDCTHTCHYQNFPVVFLQIKPLRQRRRHGTAQLQRRTLTARRTAEEVGNGGCQEDRGRYHRAHRMAVQGCLNDLIGSFVCLHMKQSVNGYRQQAAHRQQENQPGMLSAHMGNKVQCMMEHRTK